MTPEQFAYWLQGYFEIADPVEISPEETRKIKDHLALVFQKLTPQYNYPLGQQVTITPNVQVPSVIQVGGGSIGQGGTGWGQIGTTGQGPTSYCSHAPQGGIDPNQLVVSC